MSKWFSRIEEFIVVITLATMAIIAFSNVITRNLFNISLAFTEEITINLFVFLTFVGAAIGVRRSAHLGFSLIVERASIPIRRVLISLIGIVSVLLFAIITYYGIEMMIFQIDINAKTPALGWPKWLFSMAIPLGALLCAIRTIEATIKQLKEMSDEQGESV